MYMIIVYEHMEFSY